MTFREWYKKLNKEDKDSLLNDITQMVMDLYVHIKCTKCKRKLPNESFFTKDGCIWCSIEYFRKGLDTKQKV